MKIKIINAAANAIIKFSSKTFKKIILDDSPKGSIFNTAVIAGTLAAKKTHELIPLCHSIPINSIEVNFETDEKNNSLKIFSKIKAVYKTGVEMEALNSVSIGLLCVLDMIKSVEKDEFGQYPKTEIHGIRVLKKKKANGHV